MGLHGQYDEIALGSDVTVTHSPRVGIAVGLGVYRLQTGSLKGVIGNVAQRLRECDLRKGNAVLEGIPFDLLDALAQRDIAQAGAIGKRFAFDSNHSARDDHLCQVRAAVKRALIYVFHAFGNGDPGDGFVARESPIANAVDGMPVDLGGDGQHAVRAVVAGDHCGAVFPDENVVEILRRNIDVAVLYRPVVGVGALLGRDGHLLRAVKGGVVDGGQAGGQVDFRQGAVQKGPRSDGRDALGQHDLVDGGVAVKGLLLDDLQRCRQGQHVLRQRGHAAVDEQHSDGQQHSEQATHRFHKYPPHVNFHSNAARFTQIARTLYNTIMII